jgi:hypothetical protein
MSDLEHSKSDHKMAFNITSNFRVVHNIYDIAMKSLQK